MAEKTIAQKLLIKPGYHVLLIDAPEGYAAQLGPLPAGATLSGEAASVADLVQLFVTSRQGLEARLGPAKTQLAAGGLLWITYPKGTSRIKADINRDTINAFAATLELQGVAMIAIDDTWSALRVKAI